MGCGCILALIGLATPRFAIFLMWLFSDRLAHAFGSFLEAFLGFLILPFTTFFYAVAYATPGGVRGFGWILVGLGLVFDIGSYTGGDAARRRRARRA